MSTAAVVGAEILVASFARGRVVGAPQRCRVVRATRSVVTLQRYACSGWHTGAHGRVTLTWTGRERSARGALVAVAWPPHMAWLRIVAGVAAGYRSAHVTQDGRIA